jgi:hypothetical protein
VDGDIDNDGVCDGTDNCTNTLACNFNGSTYANEACNIPSGCDTCSGANVVDGDSDNDGVCDGVDNCSDITACNYNDAGNEACIFADPCSCTATWNFATSSLTGISQTTYLPRETFTFEATTLSNVSTIDVQMSAVGGTTSNWASDLLIAVVDPNGNSAEWGGYQSSTLGQSFTFISWLEWSWDMDCLGGQWLRRFHRWCGLYPTIQYFRRLRGGVGLHGQHGVQLQCFCHQ